MKLTVISSVLSAFSLRSVNALPLYSPNTKSNSKVSVLLCPAQFCVPADYDDFFGMLRRENKKVATCVTAPLSRTDWIKVGRQLPTAEFLQARLPVKKTLSWYFDAIEDGVTEILAREGPDARIALVGHSIGGWVARAYLGGLSESSTAVYRQAMKQVTSFTTVGTPHISPQTALVDQTRGLLRAIAETEACSPQALKKRGIDVTCISSAGLKGSFLTTNVEEFIAAASYLPLVGKLNAEGDGIVPIDLAFMEGSRAVVLEECSTTKAPIRHAHVLPTPWNLWDGTAPSLRLDEAQYPSYFSPGVVSQWAQYIQ